MYVKFKIFMLLAVVFNSHNYFLDGKKGKLLRMY